MGGDAARAGHAIKYVYCDNKCVQLKEPRQAGGESDPIVKRRRPATRRVLLTTQLQVWFKSSNRTFETGAKNVPRIVSRAKKQLRAEDPLFVFVFAFVFEECQTFDRFHDHAVSLPPTVRT